MSRFADIILPLAQPAYTYLIPEEIEVEVGCLVVVRFGVGNKFIGGVVKAVHDNKPNFKRIKSIHARLYDRPIVAPMHIELWEWIAGYYLCTIGEVMRAALPTLIKPRGGSEFDLVEAQFSPRKECYVTLEATSQLQLEEWMAKLQKSRATKQCEALEMIAKAWGDKSLRTSLGSIPRRVIDAPKTLLTGLEKRKYVTLSDHERHIETCGNQSFMLPVLSPEQQEVNDQISQQWRDHSTVLLHGVTGSGKTEIYIHQIAKVLAEGGDVLMIVPEIALTTQLIERMERIFGSRVTPYNSSISNERRAELFLKLSHSQGGEFVVGTRSAILLPLRKLHLIVVDEEHDQSYKQREPAPRYNARDCAVCVAHLFGIHTLLGSATPSLESWLNGQEGGKYGYCKLESRYGGARLPRIIISDVVRAAKRGERRSHLNLELLEACRGTLERGEQVILFQNRRGYSPYVECPSCGWSARCPHCNVTLSLHQKRSQLECHYCGYTTPQVAICPACNGAHVAAMGFGTEKIESEIATLLPEARVVRLDRDTANSISAFRRIIGAFERGEANVLVGTQMITKGLDFSNVTVVGVLNGDNLLNAPDFRAAERAFSMITQVAGRAGRGEKEGVVIIQTAQPEHPVIRQAAHNDYTAMATTQLAERHEFFYPPYSRIVNVALYHTDVELLARAAKQLAAGLQQRFGRRASDPISPSVDRIRGESSLYIMLRIESGASFVRARELLRTATSHLLSTAQFKSVRVVFDVDPQ